MRVQVKTIEFLLTEWAKWAYENRGLSLSYPSIDAPTRLRSASGAGSQITDDEAETIDAAVSRLGRKRRDQYNALVLHYLHGKSYRTIARELNVHHRVVSDMVNGGRMWLEGHLTLG